MKEALEEAKETGLTHSNVRPLKEKKIAGMACCKCVFQAVLSQWQEVVYTHTYTHNNHSIYEMTRLLICRKSRLLLPWLPHSVQEVGCCVY